MALKHTPLYDRHVAAGARLVDFGGWEMPVQYHSPVEEHHAVRRDAGIFDVSHMGRFSVTGPQAGEFLDSLVPNNVLGLVNGKLLYTQICNPNGGILDDLIIGRWSPTEYSVVVNAARLDHDREWMKSHLGKFDCRLSDESSHTGMIAIQGPKALERLAPHTPEKILELKPFRQTRTTLFGYAVALATTGYTGERGCEVIAPNDASKGIWDKLVGAGLAPIGLAARDSLRLEKGFCLYGSDIDESTTPIEAGLAWTVKPNGRPFIGSGVVLEQLEKGVSRMLVGFVMEGKGIPRHGCMIYDGEKEVGPATSGGWSPTRDCGVGMFYAPLALAKEGTPLQIAIRNKQSPIKVAKRPMV